MSLETEQAASKTVRLDNAKWLFSLAFFSFLSLINITAFMPGFENVHLHFLYAHIFISVLFARRALPLWGYLLSLTLFDLMFTFASFNLPIIALYYLALNYLKQKNLGWNGLSSWFIFAISICLFELLRYCLASLFIEAHASFDIVLKTAALHICAFPIVLFCHKSIIHLR